MSKRNRETVLTYDGPKGLAGVGPRSHACLVDGSDTDLVFRVLLEVADGVLQGGDLKGHNRLKIQDSNTFHQNHVIFNMDWCTGIGIETIVEFDQHLLFITVGMEIKARSRCHKDHQQ